jgi:cyclopropane fatty-acyl-phospholipid synthase-like methyltransferase
MRRPVFIAKQARDAKGVLGRIIASRMAHETWAQNRRAIDALGVGRGDHVLDIGCGPGAVSRRWQIWRRRDVSSAPIHPR